MNLTVALPLSASERNIATSARPILADCHAIIEKRFDTLTTQAAQAGLFRGLREYAMRSEAEARGITLPVLASEIAGVYGSAAAPATRTPARSRSTAARTTTGRNTAARTTNTAPRSRTTATRTRTAGATAS
jgi:hypothetical protein